MRTIKTTTIATLAVVLLAGSAIGVAAQDEGAEPLTTSFTGSFTSQADMLSEGSVTRIDGLDHVEGLASIGSMVSSDPRLTGTFTYTANWLIDPAATTIDVAANILKAATYDLTNEDGGWLGEVTGFGNVDLGVNHDVIVFEGRGGYEGLTAVVLVDWRDWAGEYVGTIFPAAMPELPEPYAAE